MNAAIVSVDEPLRRRLHVGHRGETLCVCDVGRSINKERVLDTYRTRFSHVRPMATVSMLVKSAFGRSRKSVSPFTM
jgi:hypothetical protein